MENILPQVVEGSRTGLQVYLDKAVGTLRELGLMPSAPDESPLVKLLTNDIVSVDQPRVLSVARVLQQIEVFNQVVRDNVEDMKVGERYQSVSSMLDSIRTDSNRLIEQLADGKISGGERFANFIMKIRRGTTHDRFEKIRKTYLDVSEDTAANLGREKKIIDAYLDFRTSLKEAEIMAHEVFKKQEGTLNNARTAYIGNVEKVKQYNGSDPAERARLEQERDQSERLFRDEDKKYQLLKDIAENLIVGYSVGETLVAKLRQTYDAKDQVYRRAATFFSTNSHVFTTLDAVYTAQHGLHESTQTLEAMKEGAEKGIEDVARLGGNLEKAALEAGYGETIGAEFVKKLVDSVVKYQEDSYRLITDLRAKATKNAHEVARIVDEGKQRFSKALENYVTKTK
ncbi:MAG: cell surface protein [Nanoarchaeota archaeon]